MVAPLIAAGLISTAGSIAGNLVSKKGSENNTEASIKYQKEEAERMRQYNERMAKQQNQWNIEQWNRENAYNTPAAQMARYKEAGLNPDLMYGQQNLAAASPEMQASDYGPPVDYSNIAKLPTFGKAISDAMSAYYQAKQAEANIELTESATDKNLAEAEGTSLQNKWIDKLNGNTLDLGNATIDNLVSSTGLNEEQKKKLGAEIDAIHTSIDKMRQEIAKLGAEIGDIEFSQAMRRIEFELKKKLTDATIKKMAAETSLTYQQLESLRQQLPYIIGQMAASTDNTIEDSFLKRAQHHTEVLKQQGISVQNGMLTFDAQILSGKAKSSESYNNALDKLHFVGDYVRCMTEFIGAILGPASSAVGKIIK